MNLKPLYDASDEDAARLIDGYLEKGHSEELGIKRDREWPSVTLIGIGRHDSKAEERITAGIGHLLERYNFEGNITYLDELMTLSIAYRVPRTKAFLEDLKQGPLYSELDIEMKAHIERGIVSFEEDKKK